MKRLTTALLALSLLAQANAASYVTVDGIHYCIDETAKTATVVCRQHPNQTSPDDGWSYYYYQAYQEMYNTNGPSDLYGGDVVIPTTFHYNGVSYTVTASGNNAFCGSNLMTSLTIPASLVTFGSGTFTLCKSLQSITVDENNPKFKSQDGIMYQRAPLSIFFVPALTKGDITLPEGLTEIPSTAFQRRTNITSVAVPNSVTAIRDGAFDQCSSLAEINFPPKLTTIDRNAFSSCTQLAMVDLSATQVENVGHAAFEGCTSLAWLWLSDPLKTIGEFAFENSIITGLALPAALQSIGTYAFRGCTGLATVVNNSALDIQKGAETHGMVAYYATEVIDNRTPTTLTETGATRPSIAAQGRTLQIGNANGAALRIYNAAGATIYDGPCTDGQTLTLPSAGFYIVKIGETAEKLMVK